MQAWMSLFNHQIDELNLVCIQCFSSQEAVEGTFRPLPVQAYD
jgi:hypothetical protein